MITSSEDLGCVEQPLVPAAECLPAGVAVAFEMSTERGDCVHDVSGRWLLRKRLSGELLKDVEQPRAQEPVARSIRITSTGIA